ncbi:MAG: transglutaminase-like domain-containing protein [Pseudomonadota bacterium]
MRVLNSKKLLFITAVTLLMTLALMATLLTPAIELTRFRNSLLAARGTPAEFAWTPANLPQDFRYETLDAPKLIRDGSVSVSDIDAAVDKMTGIVAHLRHLPKKRGPIQSDTLTTYRIIRSEGRGYCADYTQVFNALAHAADLPVREWGLSFDRFSGDGHAFSEVFDDKVGRWMFVDPMHGFYVRSRATGDVLSVLEFRARLLQQDGLSDTEIVPIDSAFMFDSDRAAFNYYRAGADQFYLWFGNDVFSYDQNVLVRLFGVSRSLEQLAAILIGIHPEIRILETPTNGDEIDALLALSDRVIGLVALSFLLSIVLLVQIVALVRARRRDLSLEALDIA